MINKDILMSKLKDKFNTLTLHCIVNECFINGLPIQKEEIEQSEKIALTKYSYDVIKKIGGFSALEAAITDTNLTMSQKLFLGNLYNICTESANAATKRIANETDCKAPDTKLDEVVDKAAFTESEYKDFVKKVEKEDLNKISEIIKEKTLAVIKDEQEQYEKEEALTEELKSALSDSKDFSDATTESYMDIVLNKSDARHHISLFSKLQESAMEMMSITKVGNNGMDIMPIVHRVTFEAFVDSLHETNDSVDAWYEQMEKITTEEVCDIPDDVKPKLATLTSIIVYTVIETLKTLNIYSPSMSEVKKFVNKTIDGNAVASANTENIYKEGQAKANEANTLDYSKMDSKVLSNELSELKKISEIVQESAKIDGSYDVSVPIVSALESRIEDIGDILQQRDSEMKAKAAATESYFDQRNKTHDIAEFNKINGLFGKHPLIKEIQLKVDPSGINSIINVGCVNESGQIIHSSFMNLEYACESAMYLDYIKEAYQNSKLSSCEKDICILVNDGKGTKITM